MATPYGINYLIISDDKKMNRLLGVMLALIHHQNGAEVYSTFRIPFVRHIKPADVFTKPELLRKHSMVFIDDIAGIDDEVGDAAFATLRENCVTFMLSANDQDEVPDSIKYEIDTLAHPQPYMPKDGKYPNWCFLSVNLIGPRPFKDKRKAGITSGEIRKVNKWMPPHFIYEAGKALGMPLSHGIAVADHATITDDIKERLAFSTDKVKIDGNLETQFLRDLIPLLRSEWNPDGDRVHWTEVASQAQAFGSDINDNAIGELCKRLFGIDRQGQVRVADIRSMFNFHKES